MANKSKINFKKDVSVIRLNRLRGRMLHLPAPKNKKREILLLYGHHASLERMGGIAENLNNYGAVTLPDLPGFGGMDSFYKINREPTIENYADYLASFIKLRFKRKRITIVAMSFSFPVVTKMLQKYPEIRRKVDIVVSCVGFVHYDDFRLPLWQQYGLRALSRVFEKRVMAGMMRHIFLRKPTIRATYLLVQSRHSKMKDAVNSRALDERINAEVKLWQLNDVRTRMYTMNDMFRLDLCDKRIELPVYHVSVENDRYFDNAVVEQHMKIVYKDFKNFPTTIPGHMPSIVATAEDASPFVPTKLKRLLSKAPKSL
jgi:pimeloyl-ACP methyl ester carboxylesterase